MANKVTNKQIRENKEISLEKLLEKVPEYNGNPNEGGGNGGGKEPPSFKGKEEIEEPEDWKIVRTVGLIAIIMLLTRGCTTGEIQPLGTFLQNASYYAGITFYVIMLLALIIYFTRLILIAPLRLSWVAHHKYVKQIKPAKVLVLVVVIMQHVIDYAKSHYGISILSLPPTVYAGFLATVALIFYEIIYKIRTPVQIQDNGTTTCLKEKLYSHPISRYILLLLALTGLIISSLIFLKNIVYVFYKFPSGWYEILFPWNW